MWSKNSVGRPGNGVSVQAKLKSPKPTPSQGCDAISASAFDQIAKRELEMSPDVVVSRAWPAKSWWLSAAHSDVAHHIAA